MIDVTTNGDIRTDLIRHGVGTEYMTRKFEYFHARYGHGTVTTRSRHVHVTLTVQSRHGHDTITAQSRYGHDTITTRSRHVHVTLTA